MKCQEVERKIQTHPLVQASQGQPVVQVLLSASFKSQLVSEVKAHLYCFPDLRVTSNTLTLHGDNCHCSLPGGEESKANSSLTLCWGSGSASTGLLPMHAPCFQSDVLWPNTVARSLSLCPTAWTWPTSPPSVLDNVDYLSVHFLCLTLHPVVNIPLD